MLKFLKTQCEQMFDLIMEGAKPENFGPSWYGGAWLCMSIATHICLKLTDPEKGEAFSRILQDLTEQIDAF